jgi:hypothetical protein
MTKLLACVLAAAILLPCSAPLRAAERPTPNDTARFLAGLRPSPGSPLDALTKSAAWRRHADRFDTLFELKDRDSLSRIHGFAAKEIPQTDRPLLYFFSGPDFLYANAFFADAPTYVLSGLEPGGTVLELRPGSKLFSNQ